MDLSWCIICDRHCIEDNLYCSTECANKDATTTQQDKFYQIPLTPLSPPSSPLLSYYHTNNNKNNNVKHQQPTSLPSFSSYIPSPPNSPTLSIMDT
ncbi:hypothetical protein BDA99DRAFT_560597 [Phascolomyces articulosus]|uniref:Uncharacterized protein n=1 Tax=Phascolomyces articulosus TaxID=60185 RepID=A0AAD5PCR1_9FUNG|nr:hypothetical protein BDA99DRAFT_560597 [Phascolomyces articulosus]